MRAEWATASILVSEIAWLDVARLLEMIRLLYCMFPGPNRRLSYTCMWPATFCTTYTMLITAVVNIVWYHGVSAIQERNGKSKKTKPACVLVSVLQNAKVSLQLAEWCHPRLFSPVVLSLSVSVSSWFNLVCYFPKFSRPCSYQWIFKIKP